MLAEHRRHLSEHAGAVGHVQRQVVLGVHVVHTADPPLVQAGAADPPGSLDPVADHVDQVADHRGARRQAACALAVEHQLADRVSLHEHRVVRLGHRRERVRGGDHRRVDPRADLAVDQFGDGQQLERVAHARRRPDVGSGHVGDALPVDVAGRHARVERQAGQDGALGRGVETFHVRARVGLRVAELGRLGQRLVVGRPGGRHAPEHVIGGAVHDPEDPAQPVAGQRLLQGVDDRDRPGHRRLELEVDPHRVGRVEQLGAPGGQQLLVGGHHRLPEPQSLEDERAGRLDATHDLDDHVDLRVVHHRRCVADQAGDVDRGVSLLGGVADRDPLDLDRQPGPIANRLGVLREEPGHPGAHDSTAEHADPDRLHLPFASLHAHPGLPAPGRGRPYPRRPRNDPHWPRTGRRTSCLTEPPRSTLHAAKPRAIPPPRPFRAFPCTEPPGTLVNVFTFSKSEVVR